MMKAKAGISRLELYATVHRADGRTQNLGLISVYEKSWWKNILLQMRVRINGILSHKHRTG